MSILFLLCLVVAICVIRYETKADKGFLNNYWRDSWSLLGFLVSAIGSALSVWAVIEATGARKAAEIAKNEIIKKRIVFSGDEANHDIDIIDTFINQKKYDLAAYLLLKLANNLSRLAILAKQTSESNYQEIRVSSVEVNEWRLKCMKHSNRTNFTYVDDWVRFVAEVKPKLNGLSEDYEGL